jgi:hypothetical protein
LGKSLLEALWPHVVITHIVAWDRTDGEALLTLVDIFFVEIIAFFYCGFKNEYGFIHYLKSWR